MPETATQSYDSSDEAGMVGKYGRAIQVEIAQIDLAIFIIGEFIRDFARYALLTFAPLFAVSILDASFAEAGVIISVRGFAYLFVSPIAGLVVARFSRKFMLLGVLAISAGTLPLVLFSPLIV